MFPLIKDLFIDNMADSKIAADNSQISLGHLSNSSPVKKTSRFRRFLKTTGEVLWIASEVFNPVQVLALPLVLVPQSNVNAVHPYVNIC